MLNEFGQREAALAAERREAVGVVSPSLSTQRPDGFRPDLAASLNKAVHHAKQSPANNTAPAAAQEAVALYRELVDATP